ncbi:MAG: sterol desaturase family protein [Deltaproteobacteria bacterium]|nr:sterol desaturase family protein [Deltaproteobacteria bacterium]
MRLRAGPKTLGGVLRYYFTRPASIVISTMGLLAVALRLYVARFRWTDLAIVAGVLLLWPLLEWVIHVFFLHHRPKKIGRWTIDFFAAQKHRRHHRQPWLLAFVSFPLRPLLWAVPVTFGGWYLAFDLPQALTGFCLMLGILMHFEFVHFLAHTRYQPKNWYFKRTCRNHRLHHVKNERMWQGITSNLGDLILGTLPRNSSAVPRSPTVRTLGVEQDNAHPSLGPLSEWQIR